MRAFKTEFRAANMGGNVGDRRLANLLSGRGTAVLAAVGVLFIAAAPVWAASCDSLKDLKLANTTISTAEEVPAGAFKQPATGGGAGGGGRQDAGFAKI